MTDNIIRDGVIMAVSVFVIILLFILLSSPFETIMQTFDDINNSTTDDKIEQGSDTGRTVFNIIFAGFGCIPIVWFIFRVMKREPDWGDL